VCTCTLTCTHDMHAHTLYTIRMLTLGLVCCLLVLLLNSETRLSLVADMTWMTLI
jgi:hypothetical protein